MTREAKISLLVGLAFIIVIGMLLADYSSSSMKPAPAPLMKTIDNVMDSTRVPGGQRSNPGPVVMNGVEPNRQIVMPRDAMDNRREADVRWPAPRNERRIIVGNDNRDSGTGNRNTVTDGGRTAPRDDAQDPPVVDDRNRRETETGNTRENTGESRPNMAGMKEHVAVKGDTVSKIAVKYFGANTKTNRDLIVKANASLVAHPDRIVAGETYLVPANAGGSSTSTGSDHTPPAPVPGPAVTAHNEAASSYTTKPGDSLWKIATEQCGNGSLVGKIKEMNKDVLKNGDTLHPNMTLKLPAKMLASAM